MEELLFYRYQFNLESEVELLGIKEGKDVLKELNNADVLLLPSLSEGLANVAIEAMASGVLVVSSNVGGMSELITHGVSGFLVNPYSSDEITEAIIFITENVDKCKTITEEARIKVKNEFDLQIQTNNFMNEYTKLLINV